MSKGYEGSDGHQVSPCRRAAYDATFKVIRELPAPTERTLSPAEQNARVWRAVYAALDAYEMEAAA